MANAARKARKKAGIPFTREPKEGTKSYVSKQDRDIKRARENAAQRRNEARMSALAARIARKAADRA